MKYYIVDIRNKNRRVQPKLHGEGLHYWIYVDAEKPESLKTIRYHIWGHNLYWLKYRDSYQIKPCIIK